MSSISSINAQNISSLYETSTLYNKKASVISNSDNSTSTYKQDALTLSSEGLSLLQTLQETQETSSEDSSTDDSQNKQDIMSQLQDLVTSDKLSEEQKTDLEAILKDLEEKLSSFAQGEDDSSTDKAGELMPPPPMRPMPPMPQDMSTDTAESSLSSSYPMNFEKLVSSGLISQDQADKIKSAYDTVNSQE